MPIIGVNECGKTTILQAIFAFDHTNDDLIDGRHLQDTANLYTTESAPAIIGAEMIISKREFLEALDDVGDDDEIDGAVKSSIPLYRKKSKTLAKHLLICRDVRADHYTIGFKPLNKPTLNDALARKLILHAPYILYFDDFRDSIDDRIEIPADVEQAEGWLLIIQQLFRQTDKNLSVFQLAGLDARRRQSVLAKVEKKLNETLTREWQTFRLEDSDRLQISIGFEQEGSGPGTKSFITLSIRERDSRGESFFFYIRDRSKGFFWFFNFVMKLEFNPKVLEGQEEGTIYLLDEPGSYLHASAQSRLCRKLKQLSGVNRVLYCTHSHYLLDPEVIPLSRIGVAEKNDAGCVQLTPIHDHRGSIADRRSAYQPVIDALEIKPLLMDLSYQHVLLTEGITDYYAIEMLKQGRNINVVPSVGADSVAYYISLMIGWRVSYLALWDNDEQGRKARNSAEEKFGKEQADKYFFLIPAAPGRSKRILQDLFDPEDIKLMKDFLGLPGNTAFSKVLPSAFYAPNRADLVNQISTRTKQNFLTLFSLMGV